MSWDTYYPETARFGGTAVMDAAEEYFAADSATALAQLTTGTRKGNGPDMRALTAASMVDITLGVIADPAAAMRWLIEHTQASPVPPPRALYDQAVALANPASRHTAPAVDQRIAASWLARRSALAAYRSALDKAGTVRPAELLPDLLHLHHVRMAGPDLAQERISLHLARAAALSWLARAG